MSLDQAYLVSPNGVLGPFKMSDLEVLVERGLVEEFGPGQYRPTEAGRELTAKLKESENHS